MVKYGDDKAKMGRLHKGLEYSRLKMQPFRQKAMSAIRQYVGFNYSDSGSNAQEPVNYIEMGISIFLRLLAAQNPKALATTFIPDLKATATNLGMALDHLAREIRFVDTMTDVILNAMFIQGILKVGLNQSAKVEIGGVFHDVGQPFVDSVSIDNWVIDMTATKFEQAQYMGDTYQVPLFQVKECKLFSDAALESIKPDDISKTNEQGDRKQATISQGDDGPPESLFDIVVLQDLWMPHENKILTLAKNQQQLPPLRESEFEGPEHGPYTFLEFEKVPGNLMPLPPVSLWMDLHLLMNSLYRKFRDQAERQKSLLLVQTGNEVDGERLALAKDGDVIRVDNPVGSKEAALGGMNPTETGFYLLCRDEVSKIMGNIDAIGGLGPQSETASQDQMIQQNSSIRVAVMRDKVNNAVKQVFEDLAFYMWNDPLIEIPLVKRVPGSDIEVNTSFNADDREGDFLDYNIDIEPYSMAHETPVQRLQGISKFMQEIVYPAMPMLEAQGGGVNWQTLLEIYSKYSHLPEIKDILVFGDEGMAPKPPEQAIGGDRPKQAPVTRRINERVNRPGATQQGKDAAMMQLLMGGDVQKSQKAALGRPNR